MLQWCLSNIVAHNSSKSTWPTPKRTLWAQAQTCHGKAQHGTAQHGTARPITAQHSTAQHSTAQHSTAHRGCSWWRIWINRQERANVVDVVQKLPGIAHRHRISKAEAGCGVRGLKLGREVALLWSAARKSEVAVTFSTDCRARFCEQHMWKSFDQLTRSKLKEFQCKIVLVDSEQLQHCME